MTDTETGSILPLDTTRFRVWGISDDAVHRSYYAGRYHRGKRRPVRCVNFHHACENATMITVPTDLRNIAADYHDGMSSALYGMASSGILPITRVFQAASEIRHCQSSVPRMTWEGHRLATLLDFVERIILQTTFPDDEVA